MLRFRQYGINGFLLAAIRSAAERISIEDLSRRIPTEGPEDEMMELTVTFNSMIERLDFRISLSCWRKASS